MVADRSRTLLGSICQPCNIKGLNPSITLLGYHVLQPTNRAVSHAAIGKYKHFSRPENIAQTPDLVSRVKISGRFYGIGPRRNRVLW